MILSRALRTPRARRLAAALLIGGFTAVVPLAARQLPRFQTAVDVTSVIDVTVVDAGGQPITGLGPGDFTVRIDGEVRPVIAAEWVAAGDDVPVRSGPAAQDGYTSNEDAGAGRLIVIAFDEAGTRFGSNSAILKAMTGFIDKLQPSDRVAVVGLGPGASGVAFLPDLERAKQAIQHLTGRQASALPMTYNIGLAEAMSVTHGELGILEGVVARECAQIPTRSPTYSQCRSQVREEAGQLARDAQQQADTTVAGLANLFTSLRSIPAPKTVVLISEGFVVDDSQAFASQMGGLASAARASVYVLQLNDQVLDTTVIRRAVSSIEDRRARVQGLEALAVEARGSLFTVNGSGANAFDRIQSEISGVYRIGIQPDRRDHDGKLHSLRIDVPWNGAVVRSPHEILNLPPAVPSGTAEQVVAAALASPLAMPALPLRVSTFALQSVDAGKVQILIHADIGTDFSAARRLAIGYAILDQSGQAVETRRADSRLPPVMNGLPSALQFAAGASLAPGDYTLKFVAADGSRIGSLEHRFTAKLTDAGGVRLSELIVGGPTAGGELLTPTIGYTVNFGSLHGYLEAYGPQAEAVTLKYEIATGPSSTALLSADVPGRLSGDDRMIFTLVMPVEQLPPGRYVLRAMVSLATRPLKTLTRSFEIAARALPRPTPEAAAPASPGAPESAGALESAGAADLFLPADDPTFLRPFASAEALRPEVLNPFRDRVAPVARPAFDAGVASLAAGEYEKAQASFKSGIQPDIDSTPLLAYLAVAYAATSDDAEAASVWETALADGGDLAQIYVWLGQALLRNHSLPAALDVLEEANGKWPGDARLSEPLAAVYASLGKGREAVRLLEQYLESGADGAEAAEAARIGVEWIYQVHAAGRVVHSGPDDVKLAEAWAARYGSGPQQALVRQWLDTLERESR